MARIVVAEDDENFRNVLRLTLVKLGHEPTMTGNGKEAVASCAEAEPDLVITDLIMPEREGVETIQIIRKRWPKVRIIAMSGGARMSTGDLLRLAKLMGAREVLAKPFSSQELQSAIDSALRVEKK